MASLFWFLRHSGFLVGRSWYGNRSRTESAQVSGELLNGFIEILRDGLIDPTIHWIVENPKQGASLRVVNCHVKSDIGDSVARN
jgi:hypothetical protein